MSLKQYINEVYDREDISRKEKDNLALDRVYQEKPDVFIIYGDDAAVFQWSVQVEGTEFWVNSFSTREEAIEFCEEERFNVTGIHGDGKQ
ncbi:hypothetical protein SAMN04487895_101583 [Paenibacillus sophorae]|uniref:Uncharacterized protein n=1 Tax=Paenibacillus sophorae TaxID=1333845 RepID=A0A1H8GN52_9BACL|nr:hypothetical protein [Paenibacillus sophorae]QWU14285.1 hypothetical protein KP014_20475 [Paenibacillus sophorae]SEN45452.1 hypothetical protein SAMN04487895_101583 [Paenibacillus sophorae]